MSSSSSEFISDSFKIQSPNVQYHDDFIEARYVYQSTLVDTKTNYVTPKEDTYIFRTDSKVPKTGIMFVGWGGNNGSTLTAGVIANQKGLEWHTKEGKHVSDYFGSLTQSSTVRLGLSTAGRSVYIPFKSMLPMVEPNDLIISGWDISKMNIADSMTRAQVLDYSLQQQLSPFLKDLKPLPSIYSPNFIATNQADRADNIILGTKKQQVEQIRKDIQQFKIQNKLDKVIILWTATTERFGLVQKGLNTTAVELLASIERNEDEISPSTLFAVASILESCSYINGSPQNTFVPGVMELAEQKNVFIVGDDFKSGQTKMKSVLVDYLVSAGLKPTSIVSYNHLGNNDGRNLSEPEQFRSKEITKTNVVDDMVESNRILYPATFTDSSSNNKNIDGNNTGTNHHDDNGNGYKATVTNGHTSATITAATATDSSNSVSSSSSSSSSSTIIGPDHCVVIKYVPYVGDSKRAMDEYTSEIFLGGRNTIVMHNTCEDSLLAAPLMLDLVILCELCERIQIKKILPTTITTTTPVTLPVSTNHATGVNEEKEKKEESFERFHPVLSLLSYLLKAPLVPPGMPVINALNAQRSALINVFRACVGLAPENYMLLEHRLPTLIRDCQIATLQQQQQSMAISENGHKNGHENGHKKAKVSSN